MKKAPGPIIRFYGCLLDRKSHLVEEFYEWVSEATEPQVAIREYKRDNSEEASYEQMIQEGRRKLVLSALRTMVADGYADVIYPERDCKHDRMNVKECVISLTSEGCNHILEGWGVLSKVFQELQVGLEAKRLDVAVKYLGQPALCECD